MTNGKRRRVYIILLLLCLLVIAAIGYQMLVGLGTQAQTVTYGVLEFSPVEPEVCIGGTMRYPVTVEVTIDTLPTQIEIAEAWCKVELTGGCFGVQPGGMEPNAKRIPLLRPKQIITTATRNVPPNLTPGVWEFWHSSADTQGSVTAYIVGPITLKDCP